MALSLPSTAKEVSQKAKIDVKRELGQSDPFVARSYLGAIISSIANRVFEFYAALRDVEVEANPFTAVDNLVRWAAVWGVTRLAGSPASGQIWVDSSQTGTGTNIPATTNMVSSDGGVYATQSAVTLSVFALAVSGQISHSGGTATVTTTTPHGLASNALVTITGASQAGYNLVDAPITVTGASTFTYEIDSATTSPSTGTPIVNGAGGTITINSTDSGDEFNLDADASLIFETPIPSVESGGQVTFQGVGDGLDVETDTALRARLLDRIQNPVTPFNVANITATAKGVSGVTRVFVQQNTPAIGQVTTYFVRDEDADPIPSAAQITTTKNAVLAIKPADISDSDVLFPSLIGVETDFTFSAISPDTTTMRAAIISNLTDFFKLSPQVGVTVLQDAYRSVIFNTVDTADGTPVASFTLSGPVKPINGQDETSYNGSPVTEGSFTGGTSGHAISDILTMSDGTLITVDNVSVGVVTEFTVNSAGSKGAVSGVALTMVSTDGSGDAFTLTPLADNLVVVTDLVVDSDEIRTLGSVVF